MKAFIGIMSICIVMPIWYYLLYQVLVRVDATDVMWLLFWVYIPVTVVVGVATKFLEDG